MDSMLVDPEFINSIYKFNPELFSNLSKNQNVISKHTDIFQTLDFVNSPLQIPDYFLDPPPQTVDFVDDSPPPQPQTNAFDDPTRSDSSQEAPDFPDACLKFISDILLEEDPDQNPSSPQEFRALEETEKSLYDVLGLSQPRSDSLPTVDDISESLSELNPQYSESLQTANSKPVKVSRKKRIRQKDKDCNTGCEQGRSNKIQAASNDDYVEMEQFDDVLLLCNDQQKRDTDDKSSPLSRTRANKRQVAQEPECQVDLMTLLTQCAQAVSSFDLRTANDLLRQIRQHASPYGNSTQRLAHHVANGLEARLAGTGGTVSTNLVDLKISSSAFLKAYRLYVKAVPFKRMSFFLANKTIANLAENAKKIHIIDFGVFLGLQWPCLIQHLSKRPNGPPELRITGIDYPQQGFRPAERVDATGHRLSGYCKRFGVPFQYHGIAQKWETIKPEDINIASDELVIVNCMHRSGTLLDEGVDPVNSPKDSFLRLVRDLRPNLFIHGVINGTFNAPFFMSRFKEALYFYSSVFDLFDTTIPRGAHERLQAESEVFGKEVFNVVACEGAERVQRPETYKQWGVRTSRVGLRPVELDRELVKSTKAMVRGNYHRDFLVDEDRQWMLLGWKGRTICALSLWKP